MAKAALAPEHMTDEQLWRFVRVGLMNLRLALNNGEARWTLAARLTAIEAASEEIYLRGEQPMLFKQA